MGSYKSNALSNALLLASVTMTFPHFLMNSPVPGLAAAAAVALELLLAVWLAVVSAGALGAPGTKHWASRRLETP